VDPIRSNAFTIQPPPVDLGLAAQAAERAHLSGHAGTLTQAMLSDHSVRALNAKENQGTEEEKTLTRRAKQAIGIGLRISSNQSANAVAQFGMSHNQDVLVIRAKLNDRSEYDILSVGFRRASEAPISMTLSNPRAIAAGAAGSKSALLGLPNELLQSIAGSTGKDGKGVNLGLRMVSKHMQAIAYDQMSPRQQFLTDNQRSLRSAGYDRSHAIALSKYTPEDQQFALTNAQALQAMGFDGGDINSLARSSPQHQNFALTHGPALNAAGYDGNNIIGLTHYTPAEQQFALTYAQALQAMGFDGGDINFLARSSPEHQNFVLINGPALHAGGTGSGHILNLASVHARQQR
jgi:uncharacterized protein YkuJ